MLCFFLQIIEDRLVRVENCSLEMYITGVLSAVFLLQFFLGIKKSDCPFYYRYIGKNASFWVYILHMAVAVVLSKIFTFPNLMFKSFVVLIVSFLVYEMAYLLSMVLKISQSKKHLQ